MPRLLFATTNKNKIIEVKSILNEIDVMTLSELNDYTEIAETGQNFFENAFLKAKYFATKYNIPTLADDSGLVVEALDNRPGVYSKRYSGFGDIENNKKVIEEMKNQINRKAHFVASVVLFFPNGTYYAYEGILDGIIADEMKGNNGFGYDAIMYLPEFNKCVAELDFDIKNKISHRFKAMNQIRGNLDEIINYK